MKPITIAYTEDGQPITLSESDFAAGHISCCGRTRKGKSRGNEHIMRELMLERQPFTFIDPNGPSYYNLLRWMLENNIGLRDGRKIILINPSHPTHITPCNFFANPGPDPSVSVSLWLEALKKPWGDEQNMPTFARTAFVTLTFLAETGETLEAASRLVEFNGRDARDYAIWGFLHNPPKRYIPGIRRSCLIRQGLY